ncbi:hypothetical protein [Algihabitans albus]|uniref:hypothetical protein n=1 Tax=Algihabitans albus TaxID=2164067 RepID=UPI0013C31446|nr:hypothetical protein [Algihabitans albus]
MLIKGLNDKFILETDAPGSGGLFLRIPQVGQVFIDPSRGKEKWEVTWDNWYTLRRLGEVRGK